MKEPSYGKKKGAGRGRGRGWIYIARRGRKRDRKSDRDRDGAWIIISRVRGSDILYIEMSLERLKGERDEGEGDRERKMEQHRNYTVSIVFEPRWPDLVYGMMQTSNSWKRERLLKQEGGTVVNKNLYPPPASLFAPTQSCKTRLVMQHVNTPTVYSQWLRSNAAPLQELQQDATSGCQIMEISLAKGQGEQREWIM